MDGSQKLNSGSLSLVSQESINNILTTRSLTAEHDDTDSAVTSLSVSFSLLDVLAIESAETSIFALLSSGLVLHDSVLNFNKIVGVIVATERRKLLLNLGV